MGERHQMTTLLPPGSLQLALKSPPESQHQVELDQPQFFSSYSWPLSFLEEVRVCVHVRRTFHIIRYQQNCGVWAGAAWSRLQMFISGSL